MGSASPATISVGNHHLARYYAELAQIGVRCAVVLNNSIRKITRKQTRKSLGMLLST